MIEQHYGRIVLTSSAVGVWGRPGGAANYASAKAGVVGLCNALALEGVENGILVNTVMPLGAGRLGGMPDAADQDAPAQARRAEVLASRGLRNGADWVAPFVLFLASRSATVNQRFYSAGFGRYARIFVGVTGGWAAPTNTPPTIDEVESHLELIETLDTFDLPDHVFHEIELLRERHGL